MLAGVKAAQQQPPWVAALPGGIGALTSWTASDGSLRLASSGTDGTIRIWDPERGTAIGDPLIGHTAAVWKLMVWAWSGGRMLVSAGEDGTIRTWDVDTGAPISGPVNAHDGWVRAIAMWNGRTGQPRLASAGTDGAVRVWDPVAGTAIGEPLVRGTEGLAALACWSGAGGTRLAVGGDNGCISVWDVKTRARVGECQFDHGSGLWALVTWTAVDGGPRLASAGQDGTIRIWNPDTGALVVAPLRGHTGWVPTLATWTTPDGGTRLVSASTDGTIRMWNPETGAPVGTRLPVYSGQIATLTTWIGPDGSRRLAYEGESGTIRVYNADTGTVVGDPLTGHIAGVWALASWSGGDGIYMAASGDDGAIRLWDTETGSAIGRPLIGHTAGVWALVTWRTSEGGTRLASTGDDGTIRVWDLDSYTPFGGPLTGHASWVPALATWRRLDGAIGLVSGGLDGTVRRWDPATGREMGNRLTGHDGWVMAVTTWQGPAGARLASGGVDGTVRIWNPDTGRPVGAPLRGHADWVRCLASWTGRDGRTLLVSGGYDGIIKIWDSESGAAIGDPLTGHVGRVAALATWTAPDSGGRLASAGEDGRIHLWNIDTATAIGEPIDGHDGGVWALTLWADPRWGVRLASAGHDGTVRLWDPETRQAVRALVVGPTMWGVCDAPTKRDVIGRQPLAEAIAAQLCRHGDDSLGENPGPTVVSVEGPWGCGKTTLMYLIRQRLPAPQRPTPPRRTLRHLTVRDVLHQIRRPAAGPRERPRAGDPARAVVTAWFNPWGYQSGDQVWAGLANEIIEAAADVLYPTEPERERYWFARNLGRVDRHALLKELRRRIVSPILGGAIAAVVATFTVADLIRPLEVVGRETTPTAVSMVVAAVALLGGAAHTVYRYLWGRAVHYLPTELFTRPVIDSVDIGGDGPPDSPADPLRRARAGSLYLYQHNIGTIVDDLAARGCDLVVFVDDIDRCRADTTAEVFEAINLFLSNVASRSGLRARFVVGLDSSVVASHLDSLYRSQHDRSVAPHGDDPTPGWAFLRKLIQLPVTVPQVPDEGLERFVDVVTQRGPSGPAPPPVLPSTSVEVGVAAPAQSDDTGPPAPRQRPRGPSTEAASTRAGVPVDTSTKRSMEQHPEVRELVVRRLAAQPGRSMREGKRLLNVWQLYARILDVTEPLTDPDAVIVRARQLLLVAEIVTRWPALQRPLSQRIDHHRSGLQLLAASADDDDAWTSTVNDLGIDAAENERALVNLRGLLCEYDGRAIADLASRLT
jgi:WD40 repeat protein